MGWLLALGAIVIVGLAGYAWILTRRVREQANQKRQLIDNHRQSIRVLVNSCLEGQVDPAECVLRVRVLLDARGQPWRDALTLPTFLLVSDALLEMPFGQARAALDAEARHAQDGKRRQLIQVYEAELMDEFRQLKEWVQ